MHAVIMTGGRGVRMLPYTRVLPKGLLPVGNQPILEILVKQLKASGFNRITMACGYLSHLIELYFTNGEKWGVSIDYHVESTPFGTVGALKKLSLPNEPFLLLNCDILTTLNFKEFFEFHGKGNSLLTIASHTRGYPIDFGVLSVSDDRVMGFTEKPKHAVTVSMGIYVVDPHAIQFIPDDAYFDASNLIDTLLQQQQSVRHFESSAYWLDIGKPEDYERANQEFPALSDQLFPGQKS